MVAIEGGGGRFGMIEGVNVVINPPPPLVMTEEQLEECCDIIATVMAKFAK